MGRGFDRSGIAGRAGHAGHAGEHASARSTYAAAVLAGGGSAESSCECAGTPVPGLLGLLVELEGEVVASGERLEACVVLLRERRVSWREIGEALGVSRQAAWQRFRGAVDAAAANAGPGSAVSALWYRSSPSHADYPTEAAR